MTISSAWGMGASLSVAAVMAVQRDLMWVWMLVISSGMKGLNSRGMPPMPLE